MQERYGDAELLFNKALLMDEKILGSQHPSMAVNLGWLALTNYALERTNIANTYYQRMLETMKELQGVKNFNKVKNFANLPRIIGYDETANMLKVRIEEIRKKEELKRKAQKEKAKADAILAAAKERKIAEQEASLLSIKKTVFPPGLEIRDIRSIFTIWNGIPALVIRGSVFNASDVPVQVPIIRVRVHDVFGKKPQQRLIKPSVKFLQSDKSIAFETLIEHPPAARRLEITFTDDSKKAEI